MTGTVLGTGRALLHIDVVESSEVAGVTGDCNHWVRSADMASGGGSSANRLGWSAGLQ